MNSKVAITSPLTSSDVAVPQHLGIIMDGNQRWAGEHHLPSAGGHRAGVKNVRPVIQACADAHIKYLTLFAFSTENWNRPAYEVAMLFGLMQDMLQNDINGLHAEGARLRIVGDRPRLSDKLNKLITEAEGLTKDNTRINLQIAISYGGRWDIVTATKRIARAVVQGDMALDDIKEDTVQTYMALAELPPLDLCIRTGGNQRLSNFLLWDLAYAELYFTKVFWPDFDASELNKALFRFSRQERRFGQ